MLAGNEDIRVVFFDKHPVGTYGHLWSIFGSKVVIRMADL